MFKIEGLSVPSSVKVDESKSKKKSEPAKLSGDDLQGMFSELDPAKRSKQKKPEVNTKTESHSNGSGAANEQTRNTNPQKKREAAASTAVSTPPTKRAKAGRAEALKPTKQDSRNDPKADQETSKRTQQVTKQSPKQNQTQNQTQNENKNRNQPRQEPQPKPKPKPKTELSQPSKGPTSTKQLTPLQLKMQQKLSGSRFRWINEQLYTTSSDNAFHIFQEQPQIFQEYHDGFRHQVESWPENPVISLVQQFKDYLQKPLNAPGGLPADKSSGKIIVADMGCGEAELALELSKFKHRKAKFDVHSFDLYAANERITAADIANVPLPDESCDVVVFCLALMGTNLVDFLTEGIRVLKPGGLIWIAEIKSRFSGYDVFIDTLKKMGLYHKTTDEGNKMFVKFEFAKLPHKMAQASEVRPDLKLKPCIYKRR